MKSTACQSASVRGRPFKMEDYNNTTNDYSQERRRALGERVREAEAQDEGRGREDGVVPRVELGFGQHGQRVFVLRRRASMWSFRN